MKAKLKTEEFIKKARKVHGDKYLYPEEYQGCKTKMNIYCIVCKELFLQTPDCHLRSQGCLKCVIISRANKQKKSLEKFVQQANEIHNFNYDYNKFMYVNNHTEGIIICPDHGEYLQKPNVHLQGNGCKKCGILLIVKKLKKSLEKFIKEANKVHNFKYDYSKFVYVNNHTEGLIGCLNHGDFFQTPDHHLRGQGCPNCKIYKGEDKIEQWLQTNNIKFERRKRFFNCRNKLPLPFDFYFPDCNILIEYDGKQHFKSIEYFGGNENLKYVKQNDQIKTQWAQDNNYKLIRIPYTEFSNIEKILERELL